MSGDFFWCDLMTSDPEAALAFYGKVVGWGHQTMTLPVRSDGASQPYTVLTAESIGVAGLMPIPAGVTAPPCWMSYVSVDDVAAAVDALKKAGGVVHRPPVKVEGVIEFAVVADPHAAVFVVAKPAPSGPMPEPSPRAPGTTGWHELYADDLPATFAFYETLFGWTRSETHDMGPMGIYQLFKTGGPQDAGGMMTRPPGVSAPFWNIYFNVDAIGAAADRVRSNGGQVVMGPHQVPTADWIVQCLDPQGATFALMSANP
jgi:predicted enzyme related to lactoylglutathione lyase